MLKLKPFFYSSKKLDSHGVAVVKEKVEVIRDLLRAFPEKGGRRLLVQAEVIERATGNKETAVDNSCRFTSSPYLVEFKNTLKYFKPGLPFVVKVNVGKVYLCDLPM